MQYHEGLYIISVAARLLEMHQQTLRKYEKVGFVIPQRTAGRLRLYSVDDVERLRQIKYLVDELGMKKLDGVEVLLQLSGQIQGLISRLDAAIAPIDTETVRQELNEMLRLLGAQPIPHANQAAGEEQG